MFRTLTALVVLPIALSYMGAFEDGAGLAEIGQNIAVVAQVDSGGAFNLGGNRTVEDALDSNTFRYTGSNF